MTCEYLCVCEFISALCQVYCVNVSLSPLSGEGVTLMRSHSKRNPSTLRPFYFFLFVSRSKLFFFSYEVAHLCSAVAKEVCLQDSSLLIKELSPRGKRRGPTPISSPACPLFMITVCYPFEVWFSESCRISLLIYVQK